MKNFIFKSPRRLVKNSSINVLATVLFKIEVIQSELRHQRSEHKDIMLMLNKLLIDKHLEIQANDFFENHPEDRQDID